MKSKNEALTYMVILTSESELSSANLSTSVTLRVIHSSMPKIAIAEKYDFKIFDRPELYTKQSKKLVAFD